MPSRKRRSNAGPRAAARWSISSGVSIPGISIAPCPCIALGLGTCWPRACSQPCIILISSACETSMRVASFLRPSLAEWVGTSATISSACSWWPIMPCMNLMSAPTNCTCDRSVALSAVMTCVGCPGAPGITIGAGDPAGCGARSGAVPPPVRHDAVATTRKIRRSIRLVTYPTEYTGLLLFDDVAFHRTESAQELILLVLADLEVIERADEILDERIEVGAADAHAHVRRLHVLAVVRARPTRRLADLIDQLPFERLQSIRIRRGLCEERVDPLVARDATDELVDDRRNGLLASQPVVERFLLHRLTEHARYGHTHQHDRDGDRSDHLL